LAFRRNHVWRYFALGSLLLLTACEPTKGEAEVCSSLEESLESEAVTMSVEAATAVQDVSKEQLTVQEVMPIISYQEEDLSKSTAQWQGKAVFPDWKGYTDDTLAMNCSYSFFGYHGQGTLHLTLKEEVTYFQLYVNGILVDTSEMKGGKSYAVDISELTRNGENTIQVSNIMPYDLKDAITVCVPYPEVIAGTPAEEGISEQALDMLSEIITHDIENGFTSAQLAVVRHGRLVYENAWGKTNSYLPDGTPNVESPAVTTETLYDLASVSKMFSVNYGLQKLVTDGKLSLDAKIVDFLGEEFSTKTKLYSDSEGLDLETVKKWKAELTIKDLLRHQGGFTASPKYSTPYLYMKNVAPGKYPKNPMFVGNGADAETKKATIEMIHKTPLDYEPGTKTLYSDLDYMILGLVIEKVTGKDLDMWLKETFWDPMGLTHITYNPLQNGFTPDDCAATELNGNTRDGLLEFPGFRTYTLQGEAHDEMAYYSMQGVSGHAGLFASATDLAKLASVMLSGGYGEHRYFSHNVMDLFTAPKAENAGNWGLGWWRQGDGQRIWYFGTQADSETVGHQGWTGTLFLIDPDRDLIIVYLTNKINSRVTDVQVNPDKFNGGWYTASTLGFVPQILSMGMDSQQDIGRQLLDLSADMVVESLKLIPADGVAEDHPILKNFQSKVKVFERMVEKYAKDAEQIKPLLQRIEEAKKARGLE